MESVPQIILASSEKRLEAMFSVYVVLEGTGDNEATWSGAQ